MNALEARQHRSGSTLTQPTIVDPKRAARIREHTRAIEAESVALPAGCLPKTIADDESDRGWGEDVALWPRGT